MRKLMLSTAFVVLALPAVAQPEPPITLFAVGLPVVGPSAGPFCTAVKVGDVTMVVPNSDSNAAAMLVALSAAEARGQVIHAYVPAKDNDAQCGALANPLAEGVMQPHLYTFK